MSLTATQKAAELDKLVSLARKGHDAVALVERAGYLGIDRAEALAALAPFYTPPSSTALEKLEKHLGKKAARKAAGDNMKRAYSRGARNAVDEAAPLSDVERQRVINERTDFFLINAEAREAAAAIRAAGSGDEGEDYADVAALIAAGVERRVPDAGGLRPDGVHLAYSGAVNGLVGPPESGKTLVAIASACDTLKAGGSVLHIDSDHNGAEATISHYLAADGVESAVLADRGRFRYVDVRSAEHLRRVVADALDWSPTFTVVDSVGEIVPLFGGDSNSNDDYRRIHREVLSPLAGLGSAVLVLDHVTKDQQGRGGYAIGAGAKKAAIDGSYLSVSTIEPFVPGQGGAAALNILKDRHGGLRAVSPAGKQPTAAVFALDSRSGVTTWEFHPGRPSEERQEGQAEADIDYVLSIQPFPSSRSALQAAIRSAQGKGWSNNRAAEALRGAKERRDAPAVTFDVNTNVRTTKD